MGGTFDKWGEMRGEHRVFVGKLEGRKPLERRRYRWEGNIKVNI